MGRLRLPHPRRLGFAPGREGARGGEVVEELDLRNATLSFRGPSTSIGINDQELVERPWDLRSVAEHYRALLQHFESMTPAPGDETLFAHLELIRAWQRLPFIDPQLPEELLPDWIGHRAGKLLAERRAGWFDGASRRWDQICTAH